MEALCSPLRVIWRVLLPAAVIVSSCSVAARLILVADDFVAASNDVRLVGKGNRCAGELRFKHEAEWRQLSKQRTWSLKEAAVVCRQLDCGSAVSVKNVRHRPKVLRVWSFYSDCDGSERALTDCGTVRKGLSDFTTEVICSGENSTAFVVQ